MQHSLAQYSSYVYDEWSDITPLNVEPVITKTLLKVEPDFDCCSICDVTGHRAQDCPNITLVFDISNNLVTTISAKIINGEDYPHVEDAINDVNNIKASSDVHDHEMLYPVEFLNALKFLGLPNYELELKVGIPVMLLRNINQSEGLCVMAQGSSSPKQLNGSLKEE